MRDGDEAISSHRPRRCTFSAVIIRSQTSGSVSLASKCPKYEPLRIFLLMRSKSYFNLVRQIRDRPMVAGLCVTIHSISCEVTEFCYVFMSPPGRYEHVAQWTSERDSEMALHGPQGLHLLPLLPEVRIKLRQWLREKKKWGVAVWTLSSQSR